MAKKPIKTLHPLDMADSLRAQNEAVAALVIAVDNAISVSRQHLSEPMLYSLREALSACRTAMWPDRE